MSLSAGKKYSPPGTGAGEKTLLKGSDLPAGTKAIGIEVSNVREAPPNWNAPFVIDFVPIAQAPGRSTWAVNRTNTAKLCEMLAKEQDTTPQRADLLRLIGRKIALAVQEVDNPETGQKVPGLAVWRISEAPAKRAPVASTEEWGLTDEDVPF